MYSASLESLLKQASEQKLRIIEPTPKIELKISEIAAPVPAMAVATPVATVTATVPAAVPVTVPAAVPVAEPSKKVTYFTSKIAKKPTVAVAQPKKKLLFVATHSKFAGQSKVAWNLLKQLSAQSEFELYHFGNLKPVSEFRPLPSNITSKLVESEAGFGFSEFKAYVDEISPQIVVLYNDAYICCKYLEAIKTCTGSFKKIVYLDQTYHNLRGAFISVLNTVDEIFVPTNAWKSVLAQSGIRKPMSVLHHGFDSEEHHSIEKAEARRLLGLQQDGFYIVSGNKNLFTKRQDIVVSAFAELVCMHPERPLKLVCACDTGVSGGYPLRDIYRSEIAKRGADFKLHEAKLVFVNEDNSFTDTKMNWLYNAADIGITCADGEGFGLCAFEMMGLGKPVVASEQIGHLEYCTRENSIVVPTIYNYYVPMAISPVGGEARGVDSGDVCTGLERYLLDAAMMENHSKKAQADVRAYTWTSVCAEFIKRLLA